MEERQWGEGKVQSRLGEEGSGWQLLLCWERVRSSAEDVATAGVVFLDFGHFTESWRIRFPLLQMQPQQSGKGVYN